MKENKIGKMVRSYRLDNNMTQLDLATRLGYESMQFVSLFERGLSKVPVSIMGDLSAILGIPKKKFLDILISDYKNKVTKKIGA
jgi:transcriptional regulator with XRE-family HTH domain